MSERATIPYMVGHVHLRVDSLPEAVNFYTSVLGLRVTEEFGHFIFLSWGERHHDIALQEVDAAANAPHGDLPGLDHAAFEVLTVEGLVAIYRRLRERDVRVAPMDHGISKALYFDDPSGNGLEVYLDTRAATGRKTWDGKSQPFDPEELPGVSST